MRCGRLELKNVGFRTWRINLLGRRTRTNLSGRRRTLLETHDFKEATRQFCRIGNELMKREMHG